MISDQRIHCALSSGYEARRSPIRMSTGESILCGHLRAAHQAWWGGCWERSARKTPKKNCIPKAADVH